MRPQLWKVSTSRLTAVLKQQNYNTQCLSRRWCSNEGSKELLTEEDARLEDALDPFVKWEQRKAEDSEVKEYAINVDWNTPRTLGELKNWDERQAALAAYKEKQRRMRLAKEEIRDVDLMRGGNISQGLRVISDDPSALSPELRALKKAKEKMDFKSEPTFVSERITGLQYGIHKYAGHFGQCLGALSALGTTLSLYAIHHGYVTPEMMADMYHCWNPNSPKSLIIIQSKSTFEMLCVCLNLQMIPNLVMSAIYAKIRGDWWEIRTLKSPDFSDRRDKLAKQSHVQTLPANRVSQHESQLIYEMEIIRERRKKRKNELAPLHEVVDVFATFAPFTRRQRNLESKGLTLNPKKLAFKIVTMRKMTVKYGLGAGLVRWWALSHKDPRRLPASTSSGFLQLQTRLDEFGRVIPGWQRERLTRYIIPTLLFFFLGPTIGDWWFEW